jgi:hypothetical protein
MSWEEIPIYAITSSQKTCEGKPARLERAKKILKASDGLKRSLASCWKKTHKDVAPALMWDEIATDYIKRWKQRKEESGITTDLTANEYLRLIQ